MKKIIALAVLTLLASCETPRGDFFANEKLTFKRKTIFGNNKKVKVSPGQYGAKVTVKNKKMKLKLDGIDKKITFKIPSNAKLPSGSGSIFLKSNQIGQNYDIEGDILADTQRSRVYRERESCTYTRNERQCRRHCDRRNNCRSICENVQVTVHGYKRVEYYNITTHKDYTLNLLAPNSSRVVASFDGDYTASHKNYIYEGVCR